MINAPDLARLAELMAAATPAPWDDDCGSLTANAALKDPDIFDSNEHGHRDHLLNYDDTDNTAFFIKTADVALVVALVNAAKDLLATAQDHARMAEQLANREATMDSPFKLPAPDNYETTVGELYHSRQACKELSDEWDAKCKTLQADLTALRARKVTLPLFRNNGECVYSQGWNDCIEKFRALNAGICGFTRARLVAGIEVPPCSPTPGSE